MVPYSPPPDIFQVVVAHVRRAAAVARTLVDRVRAAGVTVSFTDGVGQRRVWWPFGGRGRW